MRILALETDRREILKRYCCDGEEIILVTHYHGLCFFFAVLREIIITVALFFLGIIAFFLGWSMFWTLGFIVIVWFGFVFFNVIKAYIDWLYDMIIITTDKVIFVDQTSLFKREVNPIHIENIGGISTSTQFWDLFPFGTVSFQLKEGLGGEDIVKYYVPHAKRVASIISTVVTRYQRGERFDPFRSNHDQRASIPDPADTEVVQTETDR